MNSQIGKRNITFGWSWMFIGVLSAMILGIFAFQEGWIGGYGSLPRRFIRLGHVAFMALSIINVLYGLCIDSIGLTDKAKEVGSYTIIVAAVFMPTISILSAVIPFIQNFYFIPAISFLISVSIMAYGQLKK